MPLKNEPPINTPPTLEGPRALSLYQQLANNIRQRITSLDTAYNALEKIVTTLNKAAQDQSSAQQIQRLNQRVTALEAAVRNLAAGNTAGATVILMELEGDPGEDGLTIPGPTGPAGKPGATLFIAGDDGEDAPFIPT